MILGANKRVAEVAGVSCRDSVNVSGFIGASPSGPAGSATMTFACLLTYVRTGAAASNYPFSRADGATGWYIRVVGSTGVINAGVYNSTPTNLETPNFTLTLGLPTLFIVRYTAGTLQAWANGVSVGVTGPTGAGFTSAATPTRIGTRGSQPTNCETVRPYECMMLDGYDAAATIATLNGQWCEDFQQGRYATWPRTMTVNDWYWSSRDAVAGSSTKATWIDRGTNAVSLAKTGAPQACSMIPRFA